MARKQTPSDRLRRNFKRWIKAHQEAELPVKVMAALYADEDVLTPQKKAANTRLLKAYATNRYRRLKLEATVSPKVAKTEEPEVLYRYLKRPKSERLDVEKSDIIETYRRNIANLMGAFPTNGKLLLEEMLEYEIEKYGEAAVYKAMEQNPKAIAEVHKIVFYEDEKENLHDAFVALADLIKGTIETDLEKATAQADVADAL